MDKNVEFDPIMDDEFFVARLTEAISKLESAKEYSVINKDKIAEVIKKLDDLRSGVINGLI
jgi:hypothetical protein